MFLVLLPTEKAHDFAHPLPFAKLVKEFSNLVLEKNYQTYNAYADQFIEYAAQQSHFKHLRYKKPNQHKNHDSDEDIERTALLHQPVDVV